MKTITTKWLLVGLILAVLLPSCSLKETIVDEEKGEGVVLRFYSDDSFVVSKATSQRAGEDAYNENILTSVEYFLYAEDNLDGDAVIHGFAENVSQNAALSVPTTSDVVNYTLCPNGADYFYVYAIANHPQIVADNAALTGTTIAILQEKTRNLEFQDDEIKTTQSSFLMSTESPVKVGPIKRRNTLVASESIKLTRVAAKVSVLVRVTPTVEITNTVTIGGVTDTRTEIWRPRMDEMSVYLVNGTKNGRVSGVPVENPTYFSYPAQEFDDQHSESYSYQVYTRVVDEVTGEEIPDANGLTQYTVQTKTGSFYPAENPFYTYPESWEYGTEEEPYLKLMIPWDRDPGYSSKGTYFGATSKQYYYRVYCPGTSIDAQHAQFLRNNWYKVILNVGILGSETDGGEIIINGNYYVVDWQERDTHSGQEGQGESGVNDSDKEAEIKGARYLFFNQTSYILYNINGITIPFVTSDPCEIVDFHAMKYDYSGSTSTEITTSSMAAWHVDLNLVTSSTGAHISFEHALNNDTSTSNYDVSPYYFTFTVRQKDDISYAKTITIEQRPAILIEPRLNTDGGATTNNGYVRIDNSNSTSNNTAAWKRISSLTSGNNANPNMYIITASVLSDESVLIGDPRTTEKYSDSQMVSGWTSTSAAYIGGGNHRLTNYYPANSSEAAKNIIAPSFRVASSYGKSTNMTYDDARRRCASYQEDGYPAGRWRLPTMAEVLFITTLSQDGMIPELFTFDSSKALDESYWCASGKIDGVYGVPTYYSGTTGNRWIRCVYDEWYWDGMKYNNQDVSTVNRSTFTWGDLPR